MAHLDVSKNGSKTSGQAFTSLTGNAHMETAHFKKGLPILKPQIFLRSEQDRVNIVKHQPTTTDKG